MTHPCADHFDTCDHCAICEAGVCCATLSPKQRAQLESRQQSESERFRYAVIQEGQGIPAFADLVRAEAELEGVGALLLGSVQPALPPAPSIPLPNAVPNDSRKEVNYVVATHSRR